MLHLSPMREVDPFVTSVQESTEFFMWHEELVQLGKIDSFQCDVLSDHFQPAPKVELTPLPPTQQLLLLSPHRF